MYISIIYIYLPSILIHTKFINGIKTDDMAEEHFILHDGYSNPKPKCRRDKNGKPTCARNRNDHRNDNKNDNNGSGCTGLRCEAQNQVDFCVPITFDQELIVGTGGVLEPLSLTSMNTEGVRGALKLKFNNDLTRAAYALYVFNATSPQNQITDAHLHLGGSNTNGPVVVSLFAGPTRNVNGLLAKGRISNINITNTTILGLPIINSVTSLYSAIIDAQIYVNVHSVQFPGGIIRGQIFPRI